MSLFEPATRERIERMTSYFVRHGIPDHDQAIHQALVAIGGAVRQQASILAFGDTFYLLGAGLVIALFATLLLKKPDHFSAGGAH